MKTEEIMKALPLQSEKSLKEIQAKVSFLLSTKQGKVTNTEILFYETITEELKAYSKGKAAPFAVFRKQPKYKKFKEAFQFVDAYLLEVFPKINRQGRLKGYRLYAKLLIEDLDGSPLPTNIVTVTSQYEGFPSLLARAYPGYLASGLGGFIFK